MKLYSAFFKRFCDFTIALIGLSCLIPLLFPLSILLYIYNNGGLFFRQERIGRNGELFTVMKFKTMNDKKDKTGKLLSDAQRLTKLGNFVRSTSLDELPQLINVIKGDMSLVGPRPLLKKYVPLYSIEQFRRHEVRPGITGWAQVNGRNDISWTKKFELDVWYVDHVSLLLDIKILFITVKKVFVRDGINKEGCSTTVSFNGHN
ncbi:MAG: sugar transferase [Rikenellaceae bacterium]